MNVLVGLCHILLWPPLKGTVSPYKGQNVGPWEGGVYCTTFEATNDLENISKYYESDLVPLCNLKLQVCCIRVTNKIIR